MSIQKPRKLEYQFVLNKKILKKRKKKNVKYFCTQNKLIYAFCIKENTETYKMWQCRNCGKPVYFGNIMIYLVKIFIFKLIKKLN